VLKGIVDPEVHDVAVKIAERTEGIKKVDDRLEDTRGRG
jgi:osmotically-inducible protein OsmY